MFGGCHCECNEAIQNSSIKPLDRFAALAKTRFWEWRITISTSARMRAALVYCTCMQFQVPQFIEMEDKIFGPLTFRQFVYIAGGGGFAYMLWRLAPSFLAAPLIALIAGLTAALAFFEWNGRPFILAVEHGFYYLLRTKLYLWNNENRRPAAARAAAQDTAMAAAKLYMPRLSESRLHDLAWSLDINERIAGGVATPEERRAGGVAPVLTARDARI